MSDKEKYQAALIYLRATAECFLGRKAYKAFEYATSEPDELILTIINAPDYPHIERAYFLGATVAARKKALIETAAWSASKTKTLTLLREVINGSAEFGKAGWTLRKAHDTLLNILTDRYEELVKKGNNRFWSRLYERGAILEVDEVGIDIVSYLFEILMGKGKRDLLNTRSVELRDILSLDSNDAATIAKRIIGLLEKPGGQATRRAATLMILQYLEDKYQVNKGRSKAAIMKAIVEGTYYEAKVYKDKDILAKSPMDSPMDVEDPQSEDDFVAADNLLRYQDAMKIITNPIDRTSVELATKHVLGELTDEEYELEAAKHGLTISKIDDRLRYLTKKYPQLASLN